MTSLVLHSRSPRCQSLRWTVFALAFLFLGVAPSSADRAEQVVSAITDWNASLSPADREAKYAGMAVSAFDFYRGTNHLYWLDFAGDGRMQTYGNPQTKTWIQGDMHANNFGAFADNSGTVVYDLNDFDETLIADYQFDLWRLAVSVVLVARANSLPRSVENAAVDASVESYLNTIAAVSGNDDETTTIFTESNTSGRLDNFLARVKKKESRSKMLKKWTKVTDGARAFDTNLSDLALVTPVERTAIENAMADYGTSLTGNLTYDSSHFAVKDVARRINAGTGSLGTPRFYILIEGPSDDSGDDRILDVKAQGAPSPYRFLGRAFRADYDGSFANHAVRHAEGYRALTEHTDNYLGSMRFDDTWHSVRERSPYKKSFDTAELDSPTRIKKLAEQWGKILAMAHARADRDSDPEKVPYSFDDALEELIDGREAEILALVRSIAIAYADQVEADYDTFLSRLAQ